MARHPRRADVADGAEGRGRRRAPSTTASRCTCQPVFAHLGYAEGDLPVAEECAATALALPMHPNLTRRDVGTVACRRSTRRAVRQSTAACEIERRLVGVPGSHLVRTDSRQAAVRGSARP